MSWIRQIKDLHTPAAPAFSLFIRHDIGNTGVALPPVLVGAREVSDHSAHQRRVAWIGHIQNLVRLIADGTEQIGLCRIALWQLFPGAGPHHLCATGFTRTARRPWYVMQIARMLRVRHIYDGGPIRLRLAVQRIERSATVMTDIGNKPSTLLLDDRLIRGAVLQVTKAHKCHISGLRRTSWGGLCHAVFSTTQQHNRESDIQKDSTQPWRHRGSFSAAGGSLPALFDKIRHTLPNHNGGGIRIGANAVRHNGGVGNPESFKPMDTPILA